MDQVAKATDRLGSSALVVLILSPGDGASSGKMGRHGGADLEPETTRRLGEFLVSDTLVILDPPGSSAGLFICTMGNARTEVNSIFVNNRGTSGPRFSVGRLVSIER